MTLIGILYIIVIMSNLTVKLKRVTIVALNLYACLANVRKIKSGLLGCVRFNVPLDTF